MSLAGKVPRRYMKIGDDVALVPLGKGWLVMKVDMLVEHTDVPPGMSYRQAARKSVAMCVSDFAAKGVKPDSFMASIGLKKGVTGQMVDQLARGFRDAEREWGIHLVGGDTNEAKELVIDCAMVGFAKRVVSRGGASPGDVLVVTGPFGYQPCGLKILMGVAAADKEFGRKAKLSVLKPNPNLRVGLSLCTYLTSAMDSSDGLARSLHTLARESGVGFEVSRLPLGEGVEEFARANGVDVKQLVLEGGEEYVVVGTISESRLARATEAVRKEGGQLLRIGRVTGKKGQVDLRIKGKSRTIKDSGWTHLR